MARLFSRIDGGLERWRAKTRQGGVEIGRTVAPSKLRPK